MSVVTTLYVLDEAVTMNFIIGSATKIFRDLLGWVKFGEC